MIKQVLQQSSLQSDAQKNNWKIKTPENFKTIVNESFKKRFESLCTQAVGRPIVAHFEYERIEKTSSNIPNSTQTENQIESSQKSTIRTSTLSAPQGEHKATPTQLTETAKSFAQSLNAEPITLTPPDFQE
jgi:hypothetical protein